MSFLFPSNHWCLIYSSDLDTFTLFTARPLSKPTEVRGITSPRKSQPSASSSGTWSTQTRLRMTVTGNPFSTSARRVASSMTWSVAWTRLAKIRSSCCGTATWKVWGPWSGRIKQMSIGKRMTWRWNTMRRSCLQKYSSCIINF